MGHTCSKCKSTDFEIRIELDTFTRKNKTFVINVEHSICLCCGYEVIFAEQIKRNDILLLEAWSKIDKELE